MPTPQDQTSQLAQSLPGFDAAPAITGIEQALLGGLSTPLEQVLGELPLQQFLGTPVGLPLNLGSQANQIDPLNLVTPVINGLGTLGTGEFSGIDPTQIFNRIFSAFDGNTMPLQQALGSAANDWQGESGAAANAATQAVVAKGAEVANQANGLGNNVSTAVSDVAQARHQMIDILDNYRATVAASNLSTPSGRATALTAANHATQEATTVMHELQGNLVTQAREVSKLGAPLGITDKGATHKMWGAKPPGTHEHTKMSGTSGAQSLGHPRSVGDQKMSGTQSLAHASSAGNHKLAGTESLGGRKQSTTDPTGHGKQSTTDPTGHGKQSTTDPTGHGKQSTTDPTGHGKQSTTDPTGHGKQSTTDPTGHGKQSTTDPTGHGKQSTTDPTGHGKQSTTDPTGHGKQSTTDPTGHNTKMWGAKPPRPPAQASTSGGPLSWLTGPNGVAAAASAVAHDPRLNPKNVAEDLMDLVFLPETLTELNQNMATTNREMKGLAGALAKTNSEMNGLGRTLHTTNRDMTAMDGNLVKSNRDMTAMDGNLVEATGEMASMSGQLGTATGEMSSMAGELGTTNGDITTTDGHLVTASGDMHKLNGTLHTTNGYMGTMNGTLQTTNRNLGTTNGSLSTINGDISNVKGLGDSVLNGITHAVVP